MLLILFLLYIVLIYNNRDFFGDSYANEYQVIIGKLEIFFRTWDEKEKVLWNYLEESKKVFDHIYFFFWKKCYLFYYYYFNF